LNSCLFSLHLDNMQAPYQTLQVRYLGFRAAVAGCGAIVCTIVETGSMECLAGSRFRLLCEVPDWSGTDRATRKLRTERLEESRFGRSEYERPKAARHRDVRQNAQQNPWR
jgi:hypothetical protein